ncbi:MAG: hypothetical protein ACFFCP_11360, partial [Promethearchaeota archaeon]
MKTKRLTTVSLLTLFLCFTSFSPMVVNSVPQSKQTCSDQGSSQISIDGSSKAMKIPVWKNEAVLNHTPDTNYHGNTAYGGLWVGPDSQGYLARSCVAFDKFG